jgi:membrane peptidoglycan carboxypeptidase
MSEFPTCDGNYPSSGTWTLKNSTRSGRFDLYTGTQESVNTFYAQLELRTGLCEPYRLARAMGVGLTDPASERVPSFTLGVPDVSPLEMADAYATFAAHGTYCTPRPVTRVDAAPTGHDGQDRHVLVRFPPRCAQVMPAGTADTVNDILRGVQEPGGFGYGAGLALDRPSAGKTGTTNDDHAVWFVGYTPTLSTAAVVAGAGPAGEPQSLDDLVIGGRYVSHDAAAGSTLAGPMWAAAMQPVESLLPDTDFTPPPLSSLPSASASAAPTTTAPTRTTPNGSPITSGDRHP